MTSSVKSPFLKKYEGKITIVSREGLGVKSETKSNGSRRAGRQATLQDSNSSPSFSSSSSSSSSPLSSTGPSRPLNAPSSQGTIQVRHDYLNNVTDTTLPPLRTQPSIFSQQQEYQKTTNYSHQDTNPPLYGFSNDIKPPIFPHDSTSYLSQNQYPSHQYQQNQGPSLDQLRKMAAEQKYKDYSSDLPTSAPIYYSPPAYPSQPSSAVPGYSPMYHQASTLQYDPSAASTYANITPRSGMGGMGGMANTGNTQMSPAASRRHGSPRHNFFPSSSTSPSVQFSSATTSPHSIGKSPGRASSKGQSKNQDLEPQYTPKPVFPPSNSISYDHHDYLGGDTSSDNSNPKEQLYYSKQPREVYFKPHSLNDYRKLKEELSNLKMGNLGPDLQSADYIAKKEQKAKMKEYSKNVRAFHNTSGLPSGPGKVTSANSSGVSTSFLEEKRAAKEKREKAKMYASTIPKPRARSSATDQAGGDGEDHEGEGVGEGEGFDEDDEDEDEQMIREMVLKHQLAKDNVSQIRKEFGLT